MSTRTIARRSRFRAPAPRIWRAWRRSSHDPRNGAWHSDTFREDVPRRELRRWIEESRLDGTYSDEILLEIRDALDAVSEHSASILDATTTLDGEENRQTLDADEPPPKRPEPPTRQPATPRAPGAPARSARA